MTLLPGASHLSHAIGSPHHCKMRHRISTPHCRDFPITVSRLMFFSGFNLCISQRQTIEAQLSSLRFRHAGFACSSPQSCRLVLAVAAVSGVQIPGFAALDVVRTPRPVPYMHSLGTERKPDGKGLSVTMVQDLDPAWESARSLFRSQAMLNLNQPKFRVAFTLL